MKTEFCMKELQGLDLGIERTSGIKHTKRDGTRGVGGAEATHLLEKATILKRIGNFFQSSLSIDFPLL
jgi:hypothetical protein